MNKIIVRVPPPSTLPPSGALCVFVVARPRAGKSTVAAAFERMLGAPYIQSSAILNELLEQKRGLAPGSVAADRAIDRETWRPDLVALGNAAMKAGEPAGLLCVRRGYQVIDGIRQRDELHLSMAEARKRRFFPLTVWVESRRGLDGPSDNTQAEALMGLSHVIVHNDSTIEAIDAQVQKVIKLYSRA